MNALRLGLGETEAGGVDRQGRDAEQLHGGADQAGRDDVVDEEGAVVGQKHTPGGGEGDRWNRATG